jgi:hypothetical protein
MGRGFVVTSPMRLGLKLLALCAPPLVLAIISRGAPRQATWETSVSEGQNYGREMARQFCLQFRLPRKSQGSLYMPQICDMGQMTLLPLRKKACWGFFHPKNPMAILGMRGQNYQILNNKYKLNSPTAEVLQYLSQQWSPKADTHGCCGVPLIQTHKRSTNTVQLLFELLNPTSYNYITFLPLNASLVIKV